MGVCTKVAQHMFRSAERLLGIDDPVVAEQNTQPRGECGWFDEWQEAAVKLEFATMECVAKSGDELAAEYAAENVDGQKEGSPSGDPS